MSKIFLCKEADKTTLSDILKKYVQYVYAFVHDFTTFAECIGTDFNKVGNYKK
jgi:hypothetical protein